MMQVEARAVRRAAQALQVLALCFVAAVAWRGASSRITHEPVVNDAAQNLAMAINFYNEGVFSDVCAGGSPAPSAHRLPVYPFIVSLAMGLVFEKGEIDPAGALAASDPAVQAKINRLKYGNVMIFLLLVAATFLAGSMLTGSFAAGLMASLCIALSRDLQEGVNVFLTESVTSLLALLAGLAMALLLKARRRAAAFFLCGMLLALLTLNNAVFFYFFLPSLLLLGLGVRRLKMAAVPALYRMGIFSLGFVLLTGAWMGRNYVHFDRFFLTERGGGVLYGRTVYDEMTRQEYLASFLYWTNNDTAKHLLRRYFSPEDYRNLDRQYEHGYRERILARRQELLLQTGSPVQTDRLLLKEGKTRLRQHFLKHLLTTVPFAYRGIFVSKRLYVWDDVYLLKGTHVCFLLFASLGVLTVLSLKNRDLMLLAFLFPSLFSYAFFSFFTHNIPRYNLPLLPVLWISVFILLHRSVFRHALPAAGRLLDRCRRRDRGPRERD